MLEEILEEISVSKYESEATLENWYLSGTVKDTEELSSTKVDEVLTILFSWLLRLENKKIAIIISINIIMINPTFNFSLRFKSNNPFARR